MAFHSRSLSLERLLGRGAAETHVAGLASQGGREDWRRLAVVAGLASQSSCGPGVQSVDRPRLGAL